MNWKAELLVQPVFCIVNTGSSQIFIDVSFLVMPHNLIVKFQPKLGTKKVAAVLTAEVMCASCFVFISQLFVSISRLGWATSKD